MNPYSLTTSDKWTRSPEGAIAGVAKGMANRLGMDIMLVRFLWVVLLLMGVGLPLYLMLAVTLPRSDRLKEAHAPFLLGVCHRISQKTALEVGVVRFIAVCLLVLSAGTAILGYLVLHLLLSESSHR